MFRKPTKPKSNAVAETSANPSSEVLNIYIRSLHSGNLPEEDVIYVGQLVSQKTNLSKSEAEERVRDNYIKLRSSLANAENVAKEAADKARKASAYTTLWLFVSLLLGAFTASLSATWGGRSRDV